MNSTEQTADFGFTKADNINLHKATSLPTIWIRHNEALLSLINEMALVSVVALDTEFIKRNTYHPILALIQINTGQAIYLIDAPAIDLTPFWQALLKVPTMVWYACGEDLRIFYLLAKSPPLSNIFDAQIAIAYLTAKLQIGYSQAVHNVLGVAVDKQESQSDWLARPLTPKQEAYAANDVRYLLPLYESIKHTLEQKQLMDFVIEDCQQYAKELYNAENLPNDAAYLNFLTPVYTSEQVAILQALATWRETMAKALNKPANFIISRQALREIVLQAPKTIKQLASTPLDRITLRRHGDDLIKIIKDAKTASKQALLEQSLLENHLKQNKALKKDLDKAIDAQSLKMQIPSNVLMRGRWLNQLIGIVYQELPLSYLPEDLTGYRHDWVINTILPLIKKHKPNTASN